MKVNCLQEDFNRALSTGLRVVPAKAIMPITTCFLLSADLGKLTVTSTDLASAIILSIDAEVKEPGAVAIPAKLLAEFVSNMPSDVISLESTKSLLNVRCGKAKVKLNGMESSDFPNAAYQATSTVKIGLEVLKKAVIKASTCAAKDNSRPVLTGLDMIFEGKNLIIASADGYRISYDRLAVEGDYKGEVIVPAEILSNFVKMAKSDQVSIETAGGKVAFASDGSKFVSSLLQGPFPSWRAAIPVSYSTKATVKSAEMLSAIKILSSISKQGSGILRVTVNPTEIALRVVEREIGDAESEVAAKVEGKEVKIGLRCEYFLEALSSTFSEEVTLEFGTLQSPLLVRSSVDSFQVIAPMMMPDL